jgi:hypothetical protein
MNASFTKQQKIVRRVKSLFAQADQLEAWFANHLLFHREARVLKDSTMKCMPSVSMRQYSSNCRRNLRKQ